MTTHGKTEILEHALTDHEHDTLLAAVAHLRYDPLEPAAPFVRSALRAVASSLSDTTMSILEDFKNGATRYGVIVLTAFPFDHTVTSGLLEEELDGPNPKPNSLSEALLVGAAAQIGEPYAVAAESRGLVANLCPSQRHVTQHTGLGSRLPLGLHVEHAAARVLPGDCAPDFLALTGVSRERTNPPATILADARLALAQCSPSTLERLRSARVSVRFPVRWKLHDSRSAHVLHGPANDPSIVAAFYGGLVVAQDAAGAEALEEFSAALAQVAVGVKIEPGTLVLIDNRVVLHGRSEFTAEFTADGRPRRWLQRVFVATSLRRFFASAWVNTNDRVWHPRVA